MGECTCSWVYEQTGWAAVAALAPAVIACAAAGDAAAERILAAAADDIASAVSAVTAQLSDIQCRPGAQSQAQSPAAGCDRWPLVLSGGLLQDRNNAVYYDAVAASLLRTCPGAELVCPSVSAEVGAALLACAHLAEHHA